MYYDLGIIFNDKEKDKKNLIDFYELLTSAIIDGYKIIGINIIRKGIIDKENINNIEINKILFNKDIEIIKEIYSKYCIKFLNGENNKLIEWNKIKILSKLTIEINDIKEFFQFSNQNNFILNFDILSIKPKNEKIFEYILNSDINIDIITLDLDEKFSFIQNKKLMLLSLKKNYFFEIFYGKFIINNESRATFISNFLLLNEIIKGKNLILSSFSDNFFMQRSPFDVITIFQTIFDVNNNMIKQLISENCEKLIIKSIQRKFFKSTINVNIVNK